MRWPYSLGRFPVDGDRTVDLRVFRQKYDAKYEVGHPLLFAEHAVYQALFEFWEGRKAEARRRILGVVKDERSTDPTDRIFWDRNAGILSTTSPGTSGSASRRERLPHAAISHSSLAYCSTRFGSWGWKENSALPWAR